MYDYDMGIIFAFVGYLFFMLGIGLLFYKKTSSLSEYIIGGRNLNSWVTALSSQASDMSGWLLLGLPGYAYASGVEAVWIAVGLAVGTYLNWKFVAKRLRKYTEIAGDSITLSSYLQNRFKDNSKVIRITSAVIILVFFTIYTVSGFVAGGKLFSTVFNVSYKYALSIGAFVIIIYTFLGGFMAVCWTDFFQGMLMFFALLLVPLTCMKITGGYHVTIDKFKLINSELLNPITTIKGENISLISMVSLLAWGLGYFGQPHILARFMAIKSSKQIKKARIIAMVWVLISLAAAVLVGIVGRVFLTKALEGSAQETVFLVMVDSAFPSLLAGILLAAVLAAIMSTADSQLLVTASALTEDIYKTIIRKNAKDRELVWVSRVTVIIVAMISYLFALNPESSVLNLVSYAWAGFGAGFGPTILISLIWRRMTKKGALAGMIVGGVVVLIWKQLSGGIFELYEIVPGILLSVLVIVIISLLDKQPNEDIIIEFERVNIFS
ncbi:sodium/proline symporter PutP [Caldisalinibacter kiritimatiensis]|uniref:Sodium/proline symporter n=1 Tax=Caldisalinibacter kiritimatiensis TaxID=1304284 RepID=R1ATX7_9FIRM|nr:sodium/proline symporter PutP [Caldisalinibacter kiritimatiensis]EOD00588.1 Proline/sodium symporter PutP / Propionate/sodium symporter [Caldisalinibacter kiritimatiensis]